MAVRIGADVGGTFTDVVIELGDGSFESTKVLTTHGGPEEGILLGIERIADEHGVNMADVEQIIVTSSRPAPRVASSSTT